MVPPKIGQNPKVFKQSLDDFGYPSKIYQKSKSFEKTFGNFMVFHPKIAKNSSERSNGQFWMGAENSEIKVCFFVKSNMFWYLELLNSY